MALKRQEWRGRVHTATLALAFWPRLPR